MSGISFSLIPKVGAAVCELVLSKNDRQYSVIDGYASEQEIEECCDFKSALLIPFPNRIEDGIYKFGNHDYHLPINCPAENNALHGYFYNREFMIDDISVSAESAIVQLTNEYRAEYSGYPFDIRVTVQYCISIDKGFGETLHIQNIGQARAPIGAGWHPYFRLDDTIDSLDLEIPKSDRIELDSRMIPILDGKLIKSYEYSGSINKNRFDDCFRINISGARSSVKLRDTIENVALSIWQETGENRLNYFQVYTPNSRQSIAIEPMTCNINAFNSLDGLTILEPGEAITTRSGVNIE
jgi:aldose 1-epimerase